MSVAEQQGVAFPVSEIDPFTDAFLADPYPFHAALRDLGPVVHLPAYGIYVMARYAEVAAALSDWETYSSAGGVGIHNLRKEKSWRPPSALLEVDPPQHTRTHGVMARVMSIAAVRRLRDVFKAEAERLVDLLVARGEFDAVEDLARPFPQKVFGDAIGLPLEGREHLLAYSDMVANSFGPPNARFKQSVANAEPVVHWVHAMCRREALTPGTIGANIFAAHDKGEITADEASTLVRSLLVAGFDTTVNGLGSALYGFAADPAQWRIYVENDAARKWAFDEVIRWESPVQFFFRTTTRAVEVAGGLIPDNEKVLLLLGSANRDPRQWREPEKLDLSRPQSRHVAFGAGIHACVGQMMARLEAEVVFGALAERVDSFALAAEPERRLNNALRGFARVPVRVTPR